MARLLCVYQFTLTVAVLAFSGLPSVAQRPAAAPVSAHDAAAPQVFKIDPPNWWAAMPRPMLLIRGEHLTGATVRLSDAHLKIESTKVSANGHWVELWLQASPALPETVSITIATSSGKTTLPYTFERRRPESDGFAGFSSADAMYLIMTDRFADGDLHNDGTPEEHTAELLKPRGWHGGDLRGIQQHIGYLQELGVNTVWITPVYENHGAQSYHGYGATDMYTVDEHYGSLADLQSLAKLLHQQHMKLVLDTVPNHVGATHPWVQDSPEPTWFHGTAAQHTEAQGDFKPLTDPHAPWRDQHNVTEGWFANVLPDLNQENPAVAQYLVQNAIWWTEEAGLDGLRLDTFPYIARPFWQKFHAELHALYPHLTTVGEVFNPDATITSSFAGGVTRNGIDTGLDTPFDFPAYFALRDVLLHGASMTKLEEVFRLDALYPHPERLVPFIGNHDTTRFLNEPGATPKKLELAFTLLLTMRGMPQIYAGDEIAMRGGEDPDNRRDFPGGFAQPGSTQGGGEGAFGPTSRTVEQREVFDIVQRLLAARGSHPALQVGSQQLIFVDDDVLVFTRKATTPAGAEPRIVVAMNKGASAQTRSIDLRGTELQKGGAIKVLAGEREGLQIEGSAMKLRLPSEAAVVASID